MCQIIGSNSSVPTSFALNFHKFCDRGGCQDIHKDGWGLCVYQGRGIRSFYDTTACCHSPMAQFVQDTYLATHATTNLLAHIRYATQGQVSLENLHPFVRELWGISWCFAHNGDVCRFANNRNATSTTSRTLRRRIQLNKAVASSTDHNGDDDDDLLAYHPIGDTDSEAIFCAILNALRAEFRALPTLATLHAFLARLCDDIVSDPNNRDNSKKKTVIFNFIILCGPYTLFAYSWPGQLETSETWNGLYYQVRPVVGNSTTNQQPASDGDNMRDTKDAPPLSEEDHQNQHQHHTAIVVTKPLTEEKGWIEMAPGELLMFDRGVPHSTAVELDAVECQGRGLCSHCMPKMTCRACLSVAAPKQQTCYSTSS